eukprot:TRINITY_DN11773_c0_g1_i1.p1 TRINITY_DN11773_c0_g1~~TRINITY_DN11773_c0_g1_i1.p1  ORF type:complete len:264 (-),score=32.04 TRINITY_DN11773_c0_g1_i1:114-872(-)
MDELELEEQGDGMHSDFLDPVDLDDGDDEGVIEDNVDVVKKKKEINTLDEPVYITLGRDFGNILVKLLFVALPPLAFVMSFFDKDRAEKYKRKFRSKLNDWDLYGPFLLTFLLALIMLNTSSNDGSLIFSSVFIIVVFGALIVTINAMLLGMTLSFFHCVCVIGYCIGPIVISAFVNIFFGGNVLIRAISVIVAFLWAFSAAAGFLLTAAATSVKRIPLVIYPVLLLYLCLAWIVFMAPHMDRGGDGDSSSS